MKRLNRKELPLFGKLNLKFDIDRILKDFEPFKDTEKYLDLGDNPDAVYNHLTIEKKYHQKLFVSKEEEKQQEDRLAYHSEYYKQLSLTDYDGPEVDNIEYNDTWISSYKASTFNNSSIYNPVMDERLYTKRKDICKGYWNDVMDSFKAKVTRTRFAYLAPNFSIKPHIDYNTTYSIRVHIPIITNDGCFLCAKDKSGNMQRIHCEADGSAYFINTGSLHWAENNGDDGRIHLIVSLDGQEDIVDMTWM